MRYKRIKDYPREFTVTKTGITWKLRFVRSETMVELDSTHCEENMTLGLTCFDSKTVYVLLGLSPKMRWITIFHELCHVAEAEHDLKIKHETIHRIDTPMAELLADFEAAA